MEITVTFRHTEPIESLKTYAEEKISKLRKYMDAPLDAHVVLTVEKFRHQADVSISVNGTLVKAMEETGDMYSAIDQVMDKIEKQVKRHLDRTRSFRTENIKGEDRLASEEAEEAIAMTGEEPVIQVERMDAKPMDPEEAAMQLGLSNMDFLVFRNAGTKVINVIYRRKDGNLGLIEPVG
jgi:putative sigma-54 modulation protein